MYNTDQFRTMTINNSRILSLSLSLCVRQYSFCVSNQLNTLRVDISLVVVVVVSELTIGSLLIIYIWARASIENQRRCYNVATATPTSNTLMGSLTLHHKYLNRLRHGNGYKRQALVRRILIILDTFCEKKFFLAMKLVFFKSDPFKMVIWCVSSKDPLIPLLSREIEIIVKYFDFNCNKWNRNCLATER